MAELGGDVRPARRPADVRGRVGGHRKRACGDARGAADARDADAYFYANERFHYAIYTASHNSFLFEQAASLQRKPAPLSPSCSCVSKPHPALLRGASGHRRCACAKAMPSRLLTSVRNHVLVQGRALCRPRIQPVAPRCGGCRAVPPRPLARDRCRFGFQSFRASRGAAWQAASDAATAITYCTLTSVLGIHAAIDCARAVKRVSFLDPPIEGRASLEARGDFPRIDERRLHGG